ncbi:MAG: MFS transporter [Chloroflexi bacterium]|nr:MFS transporter [Chloroflexota bacterium]
MIHKFLCALRALCGEIWLSQMLRRFDYSWVILTAGFVVLFFNSGTRFAFGLVLRPMAEDLGWSRSSLSLAVTAFFFVSALAMPVVGRLVDRYSLRLVLASAALVSAIGIGLMGTVTAQWQVFALYGLVYGIGNAGTSIAPIGVMISRWFSRRRGIATSAAISGNAAGQLVIIMLLASSLTAIGWRGAFLALGVANLVFVVPLIALALRAMPREQAAVRVADPDVIVTSDTISAAASPAGGLRSVTASRQLWLLLGIYAVCGFQDFLVAMHVVAFAQDQGVGQALAGNLLALMGLFGLIGVLLTGLLADAYGAARPTALCFLMRVGLFAFIIYFQDTPSILAFALLYGFTFLITAPLTLMFAASIFGAARLGMVSGLISAVHQVAGGLGAFAGGLVFDLRGSYDIAFALMLALAVLALLLTLMVRERPAALVEAA